MDKLIKPIVFLAILGIAVCLSVGCVTKATGGGWFEDILTGNICEFGFNVNLKDNQGAVDNDKTITGQFHLIDTIDGMELQLDVVDIAPENTEEDVCLELLAGMPEGTTLDGGAAFIGLDKITGIPYMVGVCDFGEPADDFISVFDKNKLIPIRYGFIQGGNIQAH